jgi:hypothetical protein
MAVVAALAAVATLVAADPAGAGRPTGGLTVATPNSHTAVLTWANPGGAVTTEVWRGGFLLDRFPSAAGTTYTDYLLWASTPYTFEVKTFDGSGAVVSDQSAPATTPAQVGAFARFYAATSFWNRAIKAGTPADPNSAAIVAASITAYQGVAVMNDNDHWGIPLAFANPVSEQYQVTCRNVGCSPQSIPFRIPKYAEANFGSDGKLVVMDQSTHTELDMGKAIYDPVADSWSTGDRITTASDGWGAPCGLGQHCFGLLMSGIDQFGGVARPEEFAQGHIDHALAMVTPHWNSTYFVCPATRVGGGVNDPNAVPFGAHVQLDPRFNVDGQTWPMWEKVVAKALQKYGAYVVDGGSSSLEIRAESTLDRGYDAWSLVGIPDAWPGGPTLTDIPWNKIRLLKMTAC